jgi:hypothetical protein
MYETNFAMAHDSLGNEVMLIPYIASTTGTITYVYQGEYTTTVTGMDETELMDSAGDGVTALAVPRYSFTDSSDNVYVVSSTGVFKITSAGVKSCIASETDIETAWGEDPTYLSGTPYDVVEDLTNECVYVHYASNLTSYARHAIFKITFAGVITLVKKTSYLFCSTGYKIGAFAMNTAKTVMFVAYYHSAGSGNTSILKITDPGGTAQVETTYYEMGVPRRLYYFRMYGDNLYFMNDDQTTVEGPDVVTYINKLTDITGTATYSYIDLGFTQMDRYTNDLCVISDTEMYLLCYDSAYAVYHVVYADDAWTVTDVGAGTIGDTTNYAGFNSGGIKCIYPMTNGKFILSGVSASEFYVFDADWDLERTITPTSVTLNEGACQYISDDADLNTFVICGQTSDNVYKIGMTTLTLTGDEPTMKNTVIHITSNYTDLGIPNEKRIGRAYLDIDCKYPGCGAFYIEPDYKINYATHAHGEISEPSGAVSMRPFQHYGHQTWVYTNSSFDDNSEQWQPTRLDVGTKGTAFRYTIRAGDVSTNVTGIMRIRPPKIMVQVKELK